MLHLGPGVDEKAFAFAHQKQTQGMVEVSISEQDGLNGGIAKSFFTGSQRRGAFDLGSDIGRSVQQEPGLVVSADGDAGLGSRTHAPFGRTRFATDRAIAIPLRNSTAGSRSQQLYSHAENLLRETRST